MNTMILLTGYSYAFAAGFFGASFFMIVDLQKSLANSSQTELRDMWTLRMISLRCFFGIGASTILYFFFQTELLGSGVWPEVVNLDFTQLKNSEGAAVDYASRFRLPNKDMALLIVWSFLAGYSQKLVPSLLSKTGESATQ